MTGEHMAAYTLRCRKCGSELADDGLILTHKGCDPPSLLQTVYAATKPWPTGKSSGLFRYRHWLPARRTFPDVPAAVAYRSEALAAHLHLENLFITFSGYWPERGAWMRTCTFKELEAFAVLARLPDHFCDVLVVASAGNTARAFIHACSRHHIRTVVIVPEWSIPLLWQEHEPNECVRVVSVGGSCDYADAISLAGAICKLDGFVTEGGALNVARRDGLGTSILACAEVAKRIPDEYFQAVGSGTGAIAAWETGMRLSRNGIFPGGPLRLRVAQNLPFAPIYESWIRQSRDLVLANSKPGNSCTKPFADVLFNRRPPYAIAGGLYDALCATKGCAYGITNEEAVTASALFEKIEGIDIDPAAAIAVACLVKCVRLGRVQRGAYIMLNITGGGFKRLRRDVPLQMVKPLAVIDSPDIRHVLPILSSNPFQPPPGTIRAF